MTLKLDYANMMISPGGIDPKAWAAAGNRFANAKRPTRCPRPVVFS